mmetsp:Transcript_118162/g.294734  ORF Transcript_118162/g.294734 Transcript_118162/m.294734 type:complete len:578 (+) Transcript_118162:91-1824(+)
MVAMVSEEEEDNPFRLPPDDQIFLIREQERRKRAEEREAVKHQRVWEKTTASSRLMGKLRKKALDDDTVRPEDAAELQRMTAARRAASESGLGFRNARREKENVSDFVAKKREMFLVQMSLDVKKAEIMKLDERAKQKEEALKKAQQLLDEDVTRFDAFLQQNDQKAHKAMKSAEDTTRKKQEKIQQIKQIRTQLAALQSEIARHRERKDECLKYKDFLVKLTPHEWKLARQQDKSDRKLQRKKDWVDKQMLKSEAKMQEEIAAEEKASEEKAAEHAARTRRRPRREAEEAEREREKELEARRRRIRKRYPNREHFEGEYEEVSSGEEMPLFFQEEAQLLDVFTSLEGSNLFLIQNSQDMEQALEELQQKYDDFRRVSDAKSEKMLQGLHALENQIEEENKRISELKQKLSLGSGGSEQDLFLKELLEKIIDVNAAAGQDTEHDPDALLMLAAIEAKLEDHLSTISEAEGCGYAGLVERLEKEADVRRREKVKREKREAADKKSDERLKASQLRSKAPIHKKTGKQIMFRSAPLLRMRRIVVEDDGYEEAKRDHSIFGIFLGKDGVPNASEPVKPPT